MTSFTWGYLLIGLAYCVIGQVHAKRQRDGAIAGMVLIGSIVWPAAFVCIALGYYLIWIEKS